MAKGLRAKSNRRYRTAKRYVVNDSVELMRVMDSFNKVRMLQNGEDITPVVKLNMFLYPDDKDAIIPQKIPKPNLDLRSANVPYSGFAGSHNRRKYTEEELLSMNNSINNITMELDGETKKVASSGRINKIKNKGVKIFKK